MVPDAAEPAAKATPWLAITPNVMVKTSLSIVLMTAGMYYLATGRKEADLNRMLLGAGLSLASLFCYF